MLRAGLSPPQCTASVAGAAGEVISYTFRKEIEECANATSVEEQEATWASVASKHVDVKLGIVNKSLQEAKKATAELQDKEARRNNTVIM